MEKMYVNYHKHSSLSNVYTKDSPIVNVDYWNELKKRYGEKECVFTTVEHGWAGNYFKTYDDLEKYNKKNNTNIKFVFGMEAYWVKDRKDSDNSNCHIILLARNDNGRKSLNKMLSTANKDGYYYKPRIDLELLMQLPKDDVMVTTACIAFWNKYDDVDNIVFQLNEHFNHFYLEVQPHNTDRQKKLNEHLISLHNEYNIPLIAGCDSHVIDESQLADRDDLIASAKMHYDDEDGWYLDYPTYDVLYSRFIEQGILSVNDIKESIENTNVVFDFEDIVLDRSLKVPVINSLKDKTQEERNKIFENILIDEWKKQRWDIDESKLEQYQQEIKHDIAEIEACNMADYFILSYYIMKYGQEKYGGILTPTGRGSAVSMYLNKLLRLTKVDKVNSSVLMYSERFLTKERVLDSHTPPDIDNNVSKREPFIQAQRDLVGELGTYDLIALGTLKLKAAWKMYARANNVDIDIANDISHQLSNYELAKKHSDEDDDVSIYSYVDKKYHSLIDGCQRYLGIYDNRKGHPCGCLCYNGDIEEDVGVILCKSETTGKEVLTAVIESGTIDSFGYLKQDYLIVDSIGLTYDIYKEIGIEPYTVNQLLKRVENDEKTWDIYAKGYTQCVNQCEQEKTTQKVMRYKPKNISELTQFVAGVRPSFQSMYHTFEQREHFEYGIKALDSLLQDEYCSSSFILYQESLMKVLGFAGFPMSETYTIIKAISKKKDYVIKEAKPKFIANFAKAIIDTGETSDETTANELASNVWTIIENSASYGFNCVSGDTIIKKGGSNGGYTPTIEEMYNIMHSYEYAQATGHKSLYWKYKKDGYGIGFSMKDGRVYKNKIIDIYKKPVAMTYIITTETGKSIKATAEHKFPTVNGIKITSELTDKDVLYVMGHYNNGRTKQYENGIETLKERIVSVIPYKEEVVYDVSMSGDVDHNFVIDNGLITCNCSHAYCMAIDSVTIAYLKAYYPLEFYKVVLQRFTDKGEKDKVAKIKEEMLRRGFKLQDIKFGDDNRQFNIDRENNCIIQTMTSIKDMPKRTPQALYELGQVGITKRSELYRALLNDSRINKTAIDILFKLNYFSRFANPHRLIYEFDVYQQWIDRKQISKDSIPDDLLPIVKECSGKETAKQFKDIDNIKLIGAIVNKANIRQTNIIDLIKWQIELLGYTQLNDPSCNINYYIINRIESTQYTTRFTIYNICLGVQRVYKVDKKWLANHPANEGDVIECVIKDKDKWAKDENGELVRTGEKENYISCYKVLDI